MTGIEPTEALRKELVAWVRKDIGPIASPDLIQFAPGLPKTRSGKIMRRILRKIAEDEPSSLGDTSTLADPAVVDDLVAEPPEQEGRVGVAGTLDRSAHRERSRRRRALRSGRHLGSERPSLRSRSAQRQALHARPARGRATSRDRQGRPLRPARFPPSVVFKSFTLFRNISFVPLIATSPGPGVETAWLRHAVKNAWARPAILHGFGRFDGPARGAEQSGEIDVVEDCGGAGSHHRGGGPVVDGGRGAAGNGRFPRRLFAGHDRGEDQRAPALSRRRSGPRGALSRRRRPGRQAVGRHHPDRRQVPQSGLVAARRSEARQAVDAERDPRRLAAQSDGRRRDDAGRRRIRDPRHQRAGLGRRLRLLWLHPHAERRYHRPLFSASPSARPWS